MRKIISMLFAVTIVLSTCATQIVYADKTNYQNIVCFGDSIMQGYSQKGANESNWGDYYGDRRFSCLLAKEYGSMDGQTGTSFTNVGLAGAFIGNETFWHTNYKTTAAGIYESQVCTMDSSKLKNADLVVLDGGINDCQFAVGFEYYTTTGGQKAAPAESKSVYNMNQTEVEAFVEKYKNMTQEEVAQYITDYSARPATLAWAQVREQVYNYYDLIVQKINSAGFTGKITIQNVINPYSDGNTSCRYMWNSLINYCLSEPMQQIAQKYDNVIFVDLASNITDGSVATGYSYWDFLHLTYWGNYEVYKQLSLALNPDNTQFVEYDQDTIPNTAKWVSVYNFDCYSSSETPLGVTGGQICSSTDPTVAVADRTSLYFAPSKISLDLSLFSGKMYGIKYNVYASSSSSYSEFVHNDDSLLRTGTKRKNSWTSTSWTTSTIQLGDHLISPTKYTQYSRLDSIDLTQLKSLDFTRATADTTKGIYIYDVQVLVDATQDYTADADMNGLFELKDILLAKKCLAQYNVSLNKTFCDLDNNGEVGLKDILAMLKKMVNK